MRAHLVPVNTDGSEIKHNGNDATIPAYLRQVQLWSKRTGTHVAFIENRAVKSGDRVYIESAESVSFITGDLEDEEKHTFLKPCPPTAKRVVAYKQSPAFKAGPKKDIVPATTVPAGSEKLYIPSPLQIAAGEADLLTTLNCVFGAARWADKLSEAANGSGYKYLLDIIDKGKKASLKDKTATQAKFKRTISDGVKGELTVASLDSFLKTYELEKKTVVTEPSDAEETEMINLIAMKDAYVRDRYDTLSDISPPTDLDSAVAILDKILTGRERSEEIDQLTNGGAPAPVLAAECDDINAAAGGGGGGTLAALVATVAQLGAAVKKLSDPKKNKKEKKPRVEWPKNADGSIASWVEGMGGCKFCDGKHLHRECTSAAAKAAAAGR